MQKKEEEKLQLLHKEYLQEEKLFFKGGKHILTLEELEQRYEFNARQREKALTRLYQRLNTRIKAQIFFNEGLISSTVRRI